MIYYKLFLTKERKTVIYYGENSYNKREKKCISCAKYENANNIRLHS